MAQFHAQYICWSNDALDGGNIWQLAWQNIHEELIKDFMKLL